LPYRPRVSLVVALFAAVSLLVPAARPAAAAGEKVVIIVGPVGSMTAGYRSSANRVADAAIAAGATAIALRVATDNTAAIALYGDLGLVPWLPTSL
jgi:hypothetical protein